MKIDGLNIVTSEVRQARPGAKRFSARVQALYVVDESGRRKVGHQFGDAWGRTRNEAINRMEHIVSAWVSAQNASA